MTWKIHFSSLLIILLVSSLTCIPTLEAFEVKEYDGTCTESAGNRCDVDDNKSIQVNSTYGIISSLGKAIYNSVLNYNLVYHYSTTNIAAWFVLIHRLNDKLPLMSQLMILSLNKVICEQSLTSDIYGKN